MKQLIVDKMSGMFDKTHYIIWETNNKIYVYPSVYNNIDLHTMDKVASLIVINSEVVKDHLDLFGVGFNFKENL